MKYRNIISFIVILVLLSGIALATKPTILEPPDGYATNDPSIYLSWEINKSNQLRFKVRENETEMKIGTDDCFSDTDPYATVNSYSDYSNGTLNFNETEGIYEYDVRTYGADNCWDNVSDLSDSVTVTIDTTDPSLVDKNFEDGDNRVDVNFDKVELQFDGGLSGLNQTYTEQHFNTNLPGEITWNGEKLIYNITQTLDYSTEYSISVEARDNAGNSYDDSWSFETDTPAEQIEIRHPKEEKNTLGSEMDLEVIVTDQNDNPVKGGSVDTTNLPGCSRSLTFEEEGKFAATCEPTQEGEHTLTFTAEAAGKTETETMDIEIVQQPPIEINIIEPDLDVKYPRGEEIQFKINTTVEGEPHEDVKEVYSDTIGEFQETEKEHIWERTYETDYEAPLEQEFTITVEGSTMGIDRTDSITRKLELEPIQMNVTAEYIVEGEPAETLDGGDEPKIRLKVRYPDGEPVRNIQVKEAKLFQIREYEDEENTLNFTHEGNGIHTTTETYTVSSRHMEYRALIDIEDQYENYWEGEPTIEAPAGIPELTITQPSPRKASPGQNLTIRGYIESEEDNGKNTEPEVTINNYTMEVAGDDHYETDYKIPSDTEIGEEYTLNIIIEHMETTYSDDELKLDIEPPTIDINEERLEERGLRRYEQFTATITYPNGDPVTEGEYHIEIEEENYTLNYNPETERWETKEIDLGRDDRIVTLTAKGGTEQVEAETAVKTDVDYTWEPSMTEWLRETPLAIAGIIAAAIGSIISVWYYFKRYRYIKKFKDKIGELKETFVKMDNSYRSYAKTHDSEKLSSRQGDIQSEQRSIREEIKEIVEEHPFLQKKQEKTAKEIAEKAIKNLLSYYNESAVGKRAWLTGLTNFKANKIQTEIRDRYADKVKKIKEKQEEENKEEIKEKLMEKHGFNKNRAKSIMKYQEKRQEKIDKIKKMLSRERKTHQIKPQIKQEIKIGDEEFKEYRARQLIKKSGGNITLQEPEPEKEEEEQEEKVQAKTKSGEKLGPKTGIEAKAEKEVKKTTKEQKEMDKKKKIKALKEMIQILEQKGMTEKQIKQEIKQQAKENGINPEKIEALLKQIEEE